MEFYLRVVFISHALNNLSLENKTFSPLHKKRRRKIHLPSGVNYPLQITI